MTTTMPGDVTFGKVVGRLLDVTEDGVDAGSEPDAVAPTGLIVTFSPRFSPFKTGSPLAQVSVGPVTVTVDENGYLVDDQGEQGVWLVTGDWWVTYSGPRSEAFSHRYSGGRHDIRVLSVHTEEDPLDLTEAAPTGTPLLPSQFADLKAQIDALIVGVGVTIHGELTGLEEDDHPQYALADGTRGDFASIAGLDALDAAIQALDDTVATVASALTAEITNRSDADDALADSIIAEAAARLGGDTALDARVDILESAPGPDVTAADLAAHAADTTAIHGIADTSALVVTTDPRLSDARVPSAHTHTSGQITDWLEAVQDALAVSLIGTGVTITYDDAGTGKVTIEAAAGSTDLEAVRDAIGVALVGVGNINIAVDDGANTITVSTTATINSTDAALRDRTTHTGEQAISTITGLQAAIDDLIADLAAEAVDRDSGDVAVVGYVDGQIATHAGETVGVHGISNAANLVYTSDARLSDARTPLTEPTQDIIGAMVVAAGGTYDDAAGTITLPVGTNTEAVQDIIGSMVAAAGGTYDDGAGTITFPAGGGTDTEAVQDIVGAMVAAAGGSYNDGAGTIGLPADAWLYTFATVDTSNNTVTATNATGLAISGLANGLWEFEGIILASSANISVAPKIGYANNSTGTSLYVMAQGTNGAGQQTSQWPSQSQLPLSLNATNAPSATGTFIGALLKGTIRAAAMTGSVDVTLASEVAGSMVYIKVDSFIRVRRISA